MDDVEAGPAAEPEGWAVRPWLLAVLGLATGVAAQLILGDSNFFRGDMTVLQAAML
ncbi:hypothetical protein GY985_24170, partial [Escherichia coli]|nr:hypothetical protein [Escherichia coli]